MIKRDGHNISLWQESADEYRSKDEINSSIVYDVVIAGGGITGITTALLLQNAGMKCLVIGSTHSLLWYYGGNNSSHQYITGCIIFNNRKEFQ